MLVSCQKSWQGNAKNFLMTSLEQYGWDEGWAEQAAAACRRNPQLSRSQSGRVGRVDRGACSVYAADEQITAASDSLRSQRVVAPATGDWVLVSEDEEVGWVVDLVLERRTAIVRRDPSVDVVEQTIVANVDVVVVVHGMDRDISPAQIERFLVLAADSRARAVVALHKADLCDEASLAAARGEAEKLAPGLPVVVTSVAGEAEEHRGLAELRQYIGRQETGALIGVSGAGKSSITAALLGGEVVGEAASDVGETGIRIGSVGRRGGRHVTVVRDLYPLPEGGVIIDTPGLRAVGLWAADAALDEVFGDIARLAEGCRFRDCSHRVEPGCAVTEAVEQEELSADRLERYQRLWEELARQNEEREERVRRQSRGRHRVVAVKRVRRKKK